MSIQGKQTVRLRPSICKNELRLEPHECVCSHHVYKAPYDHNRHGGIKQTIPKIGEVSPPNNNQATIRF